MRPESRRQRRGRKRRAQQIHARQERLLLAIDASYQDGVPERVEVAPPLVHNLGEIGVQVLGVELASGVVGL